jgi:hypothetical protein
MEEPQGRNHLEEPGTDGRIILNCTLYKWGVKVWPGFIWLRLGTSGRFL